MLPSSLQESPDRDEIILFAPMQTSPKNQDLKYQTQQTTLHSRIHSNDSPSNTNNYIVMT